MRAALGLVLLSLATAASGSTAASQSGPCRATLPPPSREPNIFSQAQENDLGDAIAERFEGHLRLIEDEALTAPLRRIGDRLVAHLPQTDLRIRFHLIDIPEANAFVLPGGRVYVSRKLVGLTRREDELAGVLGHELGHLVARQQTMAMTRQLREVLGVTSIGDRQDVFEKYNRLMENAGRKPGAFNATSHDTADQIAADRLGLFLVAAAGYDPRAHAELFDRFARTGGDTGGFFSRVFGTVSPDARRLSELLKTNAAMPPECTPPPAPSAQAYRQWQAAVATASVTSLVERLPGLVGQHALTPFRDRIEHVRFSPDGRFVLVQDGGVIAVLGRRPFAFRFAIPARRARPAEFSADSASVVFHTADLRVERWSVSAQAVADVYELHWPASCVSTAASPDGRSVACVDATGQLTVLETESGREIFQKKSFASGYVTLRYSPTGQYLAAGFTGYTASSAIVYDIVAKKEVPLRDGARRLLTASFAFTTGDRILGYNARDPGKSGVVQLPRGDVVQEVALPAAAVKPATQSRYAVVRPAGELTVGVLDLQSQQTAAGFQALALDVFEEQVVTDTGVGEIGLFEIEGKRQIATVTLPTPPITAARTAAVSPDFRWLAVSGASRGAVWDLTRRLPVAFMREFAGAFFDGTAMIGDFPERGGEARTIAKFDGDTRRLTPLQRLAADAPAVQHGSWLLTYRTIPRMSQAAGAEYQLRDIRQTEPLWTATFDRDRPAGYWLDSQSDAVAFIWAGDSPGGRTRIASDERLRKIVSQGDVQGDFLLELMDAATGRLRGRVLIETGKGSFHPTGVVVRGDRIFVSDSLGRVLVYAMSTSEPRGYVIGDTPVVSRDGAWLAVSTGRGRLAVHDATALTVRRDLRFTHDVVFAAFSPDGARLFVLTADQVAHVIAVG